MGRKARTPSRAMIAFTDQELKTLTELAQHYDASVSWVVRQIVVGKLSALKILEA